MESMINVINVRSGIPKKPNFVYCGRSNPRLGLVGSVLGNPYPLNNPDDEAERAVVIERFAGWLEARVNRKDPPILSELVRMRNLVLEHGSVDLGCWCAPKRCHCDVLKAEIEKLLRAV
jgi:hypothetical protein